MYNNLCTDMHSCENLSKNDDFDSAMKFEHISIIN